LVDKRLLKSSKQFGLGVQVSAPKFDGLTLMFQRSLALAHLFQHCANSRMH